MKIISLNTWAGVVYDSLLTFFTNNVDTDIFCLQEIYKDAVGKDELHPTLPFNLDIFTRISEVLSATHVGYFRPCYKDFYGLAIFVKKDLPVLGEGSVMVHEDETPAVRGMHSRIVQYLQIMYGEKPLCIANVHGLWNGKGKTDYPERIKQSERIHAFVKDQTMPIVLMGDFNLNPDTTSLALAGQGMRNLVAEYGVMSTRTPLYAKEGKFADYAFVTPNIFVESFAVLPDVVSDHAPLSIQIRV